MKKSATLFSLLVIAVPATLAIALLLGGGLNALQGAAVSTGIPFTLVILVMCYCLWIGLKHERQKM
jgi:BCCT family betaine/carnitine transporter